MSISQANATNGSKLPPLAQDYYAKLTSYCQHQPGVIKVTPQMLMVLAHQLKDSRRRHDYFRAATRHYPPQEVADPALAEFDPIRAAVWHLRQGDPDEACWLVFLATHFARHLTDKWGLVRTVYGALGGTPWTWDRTSHNLGGFSAWVAAKEDAIRTSPFGHRFGNHRKFESLKYSSARGLPAVVSSYIAWVHAAPGSDHTGRLWLSGVPAHVADPFDELYQSLDAVVSFGRLAKFDYLLMLRDLGILDVTPSRLYVAKATGPRDGIRLLTGSQGAGGLSSRQLETIAMDIAGYLGVDAAEMEDALCNWQKSPNSYRYFGG